MSKEFIATGLIGLTFDRAKVVAGNAGYRVRVLIQEGILINKKEVFPKDKNYILIELENNKVKTANKHA
jgi:hypothetical protein